MTSTMSLQKVLSKNEHDLLRSRLIAIEYPDMNFDEYVRRIRKVAEDVGHLFAEIRDFLNDDVPYQQRPSCIKIVNLPTSESVSMPPVGSATLKRIAKPDYLSENLLTLIGCLFGHPYSMYCEGRGLINNLVPTQATAGEITGLGASSDLHFHAENSALRFLADGDCSPAALFLTGVRQDVAPPRTRLSDARLALELLGPEDQEILASPQYRIKLPYRWRSYRDGYADARTRLIPLVEWDRRGLVVRAAFYGDMIADFASAAAERAARNFEQALEQVALDEVVAPGELIGIDNRFTLHARTPFQASFDAEGRALRWAQRLFVADSLATFEGWSVSDGCVFAPQFDAAA